MKKIILELIVFIPMMGIWFSAYSNNDWIKWIGLFVSVVVLATWQYIRGGDYVQDLYER